MAIAWGAKVSAEFRRKVIDLCEWLGADPSHLMAAMAFETGETFSASVRNRASGATGLIQFMPSTARSLGTTTDKLAAMTAEDQLDYVRKYFAPYRNKMTTLSDVYMAILWPAAVGKPEAAVLFRRPSRQYDQNSGLDTNRDGEVTKGEAASKVQNKLARGLDASRRA